MEENMNTKNNNSLDPANDDFGLMLNCAVRYAIGRQTYMPSAVIGFITPLLPQINDRTLHCFDQDIVDAKYSGGYGDPTIDEPGWIKFHENVKDELIKRGLSLYKHWREQECANGTM
jgi:hypothetical protein